MASTVVEAEAHTASDGFLRLNLTVGVPDADVTVTVFVVRAKAKWPTANG